MTILTSEHAVCVWVPLFPLRCEEARRPELGGRPLGLLAPDDPKRLWQVGPRARRAGVRPGMTVSRAIGLCPALVLLEPDPVYYDERFAGLLLALHDVSPVVEPVELGRAFVGVDGLEGLYGEPGRVMEAIQCGVRNAECGIDTRASTASSASDRTPSIHSACRMPHSGFRLGWGRGKFVSWVAASRARPGSPVVVKAGREGRFLASQ
ncbi:MAG TPA: hypothetical protein VNI61_02340, partial [Gemmatimonadales bacterium]|nr:hypothetical protein [Gemmatimonadales bacterium]